LFTHGLHGESAAGHLEAGVITSLPVDEPEPSADHDQHEREDGESADGCAPSQPNDAPDVPPPGTSPLEVTEPCCSLPCSGAQAVIVRPAGKSPPPSAALRI
jgi:hypothetical protein